MSLPPGPPSFNIHTDNNIKYCPERLDHHNQAVTASAEEPPITIHTSGVTNNWCGRTEARQASEGAGKRIMSRPADRTRYPTARSSAANATPVPDRTAGRKQETVIDFLSAFILKTELK